MTRKDEIAATNVMQQRKGSRRASFGTTSMIAIQELKKNMEDIQAEDRVQTANRLIKAMEDCSQLSKKLDHVKNQKKATKISRATLKKLTGKKEGVMKVHPKIRKQILLGVYRESRAQWSGRPPRLSTSKEESIAAAKLLLSSDAPVHEEELEEAKAAVRVPEVWILYTTVTKSMLAKMIMKGFLEQEKETAGAATKFWDTLA